MKTQKLVNFKKDWTSLGLPAAVAEVLSGARSVSVPESRNDLLDFMETEFAQDHAAEPFQAHHLAEAQAWRLLRAREVFNINNEWPAARDRYGDTDFGRFRLSTGKPTNGIPKASTVSSPPSGRSLSGWLSTS